MLVRAGGDQLAVGRDEIDREEVVGGEPVLAREPAEPAAEREPGDARRRDDPAGRGEPEGLGLVIEIGKRRAAFHARRPVGRIDVDGIHRRQIDYEAIVAHRRARDVVSAAADRHLQVVLAGEVHGGDDVGDAGATHDQGRAPVDHGIPERARFVVVRVGRPD